MGRHMTVVGLFSPQRDADQVVTALGEEGYAAQDISVIGPGRDSASDDTSQRRQDVADGAALGAGVGGVAALLATAAVWVIPGFGPILALGPLTAVLTAAGGGGLIGALVEWDIPEEAGRRYQEKVREGHFLVLVRTAGDASRAIECMRWYDAQDVYVSRPVRSANPELRRS